MTAVAVIALGPGAGAQTGRARGNSAGQARNVAVLAKLRAEAGKLDGVEFSELFSTLRSPKHRLGLGLSGEQIQLLDRLEKLARDVTKAWLLRDIDAVSRPGLDLLEWRLSREGKRLRTRVIAHFEVMAMAGILTTEQARHCRLAMRRRAEPLLPGRDGPPIVAAAEEERPAAELAEILRYETHTRDRAGLIFYVILGKPGMRDAFSKGTGHLDPVRRKLAQRDMPRIPLPAAQADLAQRLDEIALSIWRAWMVRGLDNVPLPAQPVLAYRIWEGGERFRQNLFTHAELITLQGILNPQEAEQCLRVVWDLRGMSALLDPALASRLRLSRSQRDEVLSLIQVKEKLADQVTHASPVERDSNSDKFISSYTDALREVDGMMLEVLTASQARALRRILEVGAGRGQDPGAER